MKITWKETKTDENKMFGRLMEIRTPRVIILARNCDYILRNTNNLWWGGGRIFKTEFAGITADSVFLFVLVRVPVLGLWSNSRE